MAWRQAMHTHLNVIRDCELVLKIPTAARNALSYHLPCDLIELVANQYCILPNALVHDAYYESVRGMYRLMLRLCTCSRRNAMDVMLKNLVKASHLSAFLRQNERRLWTVLVEKAFELHRVYSDMNKHVRARMVKKLILRKLS